MTDLPESPEERVALFLPSQARIDRLRELEGAAYQGTDVKQIQQLWPDALSVPRDPAGTSEASTSSRVVEQFHDQECPHVFLNVTRCAC